MAVASQAREQASSRRIAKKTLTRTGTDQNRKERRQREKSCSHHEERSDEGSALLFQREKQIPRSARDDGKCRFRVCPRYSVPIRVEAVPLLRTPVRALAIRPRFLIRHTLSRRIVEM